MNVNGIQYRLQTLIAVVQELLDWKPSRTIQPEEESFMGMTMLAVGLAAAALLVFVVVIAMGGALQAGLAPWPGVAVAVLAVAAFAVPRERRSLVVAGLLAASGILGVVYGLIRTEFLTAISFPGPIFGIILGVPILGLAVAEAIATTRDRKN